MIAKSNTADEMAKTFYNKLQLLKAEPFQIHKVQPHTVARNEERVPNTV